MCVIRVQETPKMVLPRASWKHHFAVLASELHELWGSDDTFYTRFVAVGNLACPLGFAACYQRDTRSAVVAGTLRAFLYLSAVAKRPFAYSQKTLRL